MKEVEEQLKRGTVEEEGEPGGGNLHCCQVVGRLVSGGAVKVKGEAGTGKFQQPAGESMLGEGRAMCTLRYTYMYIQAKRITFHSRPFSS